MKKLIKNKLFNLLIINGKKENSEKILLKGLKLIQKQNFKSHKDIIRSSFINTSTLVYIKQIKRKKKKTKEFPFILSKKDRISSSMKLIIQNSLKNSNVNFFKNFSEEIVLSSKSQSYAIKNKNIIYDKAFVQKKYANFRWF
jgi:ribosomal protein S7